MNEFIIGETNKWYNTKTNSNIRPENGDMCLFATFYDGWHYNTGYYIQEEDKLILDDAFCEKDCTRVEFNDFERWMKFEEPDLEWK